MSKCWYQQVALAVEGIRARGRRSSAARLLRAHLPRAYSDADHPRAARRLVLSQERARPKTRTRWRRSTERPSTAETSSISSRAKPKRWRAATAPPNSWSPSSARSSTTLIERTLLLQAASQAGVTVTADEVDRRLLALSSEYPAGTFDEVLEKTRLTKQDHRRMTREQLIIEKLLQAQVFARVAVTEGPAPSRLRRPPRAVH